MEPVYEAATAKSDISDVLDPADVQSLHRYLYIYISHQYLSQAVCVYIHL